jgi:hypothetical protein
MPCKACHSVNQSPFGGEIGVHFLGLRNIDTPTVWVFPQLLVCMDCGFTEFNVPEAERERLVTLSLDQERTLTSRVRWKPAQRTEIKFFPPLRPNSERNGS